MKVGQVGKVVQNIMKGLSEFKIRDGLSNVEKGCVENVSSIEISVDIRERWRASRRLKPPLILVHHVACSHETGAMKFQSDRVPKAGEE